MSMVLTKAYQKVFKEYASSLGFKQKGSLFIRTVGDEIIQTVYLFKGSAPNEFTLNIGLYPYCLNNDKTSLKEGNFRLEDFLVNHYDWWEYDRFDYSKTVLVVNVVLKLFEKHVQPILEKVIDCHTYLDFINNYEMKKYGEILLNNFQKLYLYLKLEDYEKANFIMDMIENESINAAEANKVLYTNEDEYMKYLKIIKESLVPLYEMKEAIKENNIDYIRAIIANNEKNTKKILKQYGLNF